MQTIAGAIATWSAAQKPFSAEARRLACEAIADTISVLAAGRGDEVVRTVLRFVRNDLGAAHRSRLVGGLRSSAPVAALVNGTASHALDYDDNFTPGMSHASAVIVPALLAVADQCDASGSDLVTAYLVALQAQAFIGWGIGYQHYTAGWHGTSTIGSVGTSAGTARLLGLDAEGITRALTLGVSYAAGIKGQFGTPAKPFHAGLAARNATEAALLAAEGLQGHRSIFESEQGFQSLYGAGIWSEQWSPAAIMACEEHVIETHGLLPKRHPCCGSTHLVLDGLLDLQRASSLPADQVASVDAHVGIANYRNLPYGRPDDEMQARFSMPYCVARALRKGVLELADFTPAAIVKHRDDPLLALVNVTHYTLEEESASVPLPHQVMVRLRNGDLRTASRLAPVGGRSEPFSRADRLRKFSDCCHPIVAAAAEQLFERLENLDGEANLAFLDPVFKCA